MSGLVLSTDFFAKTILLNVEKIPNFNQAGVFWNFIYLFKLQISAKNLDSKIFNA
jgi:hypothetical protein